MRTTRSVPGRTSPSEPADAPRGAPSSRRGRPVLALAASAGLVLVLGACTQDAAQDAAGDVLDDPAAVDSGSAESGAEDVATAEPEPRSGLGYAYDDVDDEDVAAQDDDEAEEVDLSADVGEVISTTTFTITSADGTAEELLVVDSAATPLEADAEVRVSETVREGFDVVAVEEDLGVDLDDELHADWTGQDYLVADAVAGVTAP